MKLITPQEITFTATISEEELRERMKQEVCEQIGAVDDGGRPLPDVTVKIRRGNGRTGGYTIQVTGPAPTRAALLRGPA